MLTAVCLLSYQRNQSVKAFCVQPFQQGIMKLLSSTHSQLPCPLWPNWLGHYLILTSWRFQLRRTLPANNRHIINNEKYDKIKCGCSVCSRCKNYRDIANVQRLIIAYSRWCQFASRANKTLPIDWESC